LFKLHVAPAECLYVGDSYDNDVIGAKAVGMQACWLNRESLKLHNQNVKADFVINRIGELLLLVEA
jgi:putative hydrolase of the HAD superfamily